MTSQRLVEDYARHLWHRDGEDSCPILCDQDCEASCHENHLPTWKRDHQPEDCPSAPGSRIPDSYMNEAAVFLAGELGQRLQRGEVEKGQCRAEVQLDESPTLWRCRFPVGHKGNHETLRGVVFRIKDDS